MKQELESAWKENPRTISDPRVRWDLGWQRIKKILKTIRYEEKKKFKNLPKLHEQLEKLRIEAARENSEVKRRELAEKERQSKEAELKEAKAWRLRYRARWLKEGEAPSHSFFAVMKSKFKREQIESLKREDGTTLEQPEEILGEIHDFYQRLFTNEQANEDVEQETVECLNLVTGRVDPAANASEAGARMGNND
ncbi:hypothetical protein R1sor_015500 [Riccia sorocarpa]|uniref:Uncharacterized protein n=1 Tax=Riccia sorocarpa TaxID=122646 RepID=A0ABD3HE71_9MARC